jgi:nucleotide-binding universal stress UspA family protein
VQEFSRIMVALARGPGDGDLIDYAAMLSGMFDRAQSDFVHVLPPPSLRLDAPGTAPLNHSEVLARLSADVARRFGDASNVRCKVLTGDRVDRLLEYAADAGCDLVLVGHRRSRSGRRSLARRLAMKVPCSLWLVPEGSPARITRVLGAVDFSEPSAQAVSTATLVASRAGLAECAALHVFFDEALAMYEDTRPADRVDEAGFSRFLSPLDLHGVRVNKIFAESPSVSGASLRRVQEDGIDLIVVGTRGQSASAAILLGSESEQMIMESPVPVLVVKARGERIGLLQALLDRDFHDVDSPRFG